MYEQSNDSFGVGYALGRDSADNCRNNNNGGWGFGGDWSWWIIILLIFGWGNNGNGFGGFGGFGGGNNMVGYELGKLATTNDIASGFSTSEIMSDLNDILLGQTQGFAAVQQTLCQGFSGINSAIANTTSTLGYNMLQGFHGVDNAICTLGYQQQAGVNAIQNQIASCCCDLKTMNLENRYLNERQTCDIQAAIANSTRDIIDSQRCGTDKILGFLTSEKISALQSENAALRGQISNDRQTANIISQLRDPGCPIASYPVPNPNCCYNPFGFGFNNFNNNNNCGCGCGNNY